MVRIQRDCVGQVDRKRLFVVVAVVFEQYNQVQLTNVRWQRLLEDAFWEAVQLQLQNKFEQSTKCPIQI